MPLPFSFSTQRQSFDGETAVGTSGSAVHEVVMHHPPGHVSTEPLLGTPGNIFTPPPSAGDSVLSARVAPEAVPPAPAGPVIPPPAPSPNQRGFQPLADAQRLPALVADTLTLPPPQPVPQAPSTPLLAAAPLVQPDWAAQIEQLRNDVFGIAMGVSAMRDRIDRLDQRGTQAASTGLATLRGEIQAWLENYLNAAVEHCMHRIVSRMAPTSTAATAAPAAAAPAMTMEAMTA